MTINRKPGNEPDPGDMSTDFDPLSEGSTPSGPEAAPPEEDEAAKLGDFA